VSGVPRGENANAGRILLAVLNLYVRFKIGVATFDTNHSVAASTQAFATSIQNLPDSAVKSDSEARVRVDV
jgi:phage tail protein X